MWCAELCDTLYVPYIVQLNLTTCIRTIGMHHWRVEPHGNLVISCSRHKLKCINLHANTSNQHISIIC